MLFGALETGGTKIVMAVADDDLNIVGRVTVPTKTPDDTMPAILSFFRGAGIGALGVGGFGPLDLDRNSPTYGSITATPKLAWRDFPLLKTLENALDVPCLIDTDVNAAALAEATLGAAKGLKNCAYFTIGTGVGGGLYVEGALAHGAMHPEWGHIPLAPHADDPMPRGCCPYHVGCLEGLASGPSIEKRWGAPGKELPDDHIAWDIEAYYLAQMCVTAFLTFAPQRIMLGGGVVQRSCLLDKVRARTVELLNGYLVFVNENTVNDLIVPPALYPDSGLVGALLLAKAAEGAL